MRNLVKNQELSIISSLNGFNKDYTFYFISNEDELKKIENNIKKTKLLLIYQNEQLNKQENQNYIIIGIEKALLFLEQSSIFILDIIISSNPNLPVCFISDTKSLVKEKITVNNREIEPNSFFLDEIQSLNQRFRLSKDQKPFLKLWNMTVSCVSGYLIQKGYLELTTDRVNQFIVDYEIQYAPRLFKESEFVTLRVVGASNIFTCFLIYYINDEQLLVIKKSNENDSQCKYLMEREYMNYVKYRHPFMPKFYGIGEEGN